MIKALQVLQVHKVRKALQVLQDHKDHKVRKALQDRKARKAMPDRPVTRATPDRPGFRAVLLDPRGRKAAPPVNADQPEQPGQAALGPPPVRPGRKASPRWSAATSRW